MSKTNCINCGAAKDTSEIKCPFCGTTYLDLTTIDFSSHDPVVCQFVLPQEYKIEGSEGRVIMSMKAIPRLNEICEDVETINVYSGWDQVYSYTPSRSLSVGISFLPIADENNALCVLRAERTNDE